MVSALALLPGVDHHRLRDSNVRTVDEGTLASSALVELARHLLYYQRVFLNRLFHEVVISSQTIMPVISHVIPHNIPIYPFAAHDRKDSLVHLQSIRADDGALGDVAFADLVVPLARSNLLD